jgi:DNA-binding response OmpR family regulator
LAAPNLHKPAQTYEEAHEGKCVISSRCSVLVVDDEHFMVDLIADVLEDEGFAVTRAYDGLQATRAIDRRQPDLVIADVMMPHLDGLSLARRLRRREEAVPIILMSAARRELDDFDGPFLPKPFDLDEIVTLARELTGGPIVSTTSRESRAAGSPQTRQISAGS